MAKFIPTLNFLTLIVTVIEVHHTTKTYHGEVIQEGDESVDGGKGRTDVEIDIFTGKYSLNVKRVERVPKRVKDLNKGQHILSGKRSLQKVDIFIKIAT